MPSDFATWTAAVFVTAGMASVAASSNNLHAASGPEETAEAVDAPAEADLKQSAVTKPTATEPGAPDPTETEQAKGWSKRVGGIKEAPLAVRERDGVTLYSSGSSYTDTKLPVAYPPPTAPGAIELKHYPSVRRAEVSGTGPSQTAGNRGFFPLFRHIQSRGIAMTAPVEMDYHDNNGDEIPDLWTMSFLYESTEDGPTEEDGRVRVIDTEPLTVLSLGMRGGRSGNPASMDRAVAALEKWLAENDEWSEAGEARVLAYNGPNVPVRNRWYEVQIPVKKSEQG